MNKTAINKNGDYIAFLDGHPIINGVAQIVPHYTATNDKICNTYFFNDELKQIIENLYPDFKFYHHKNACYINGELLQNI